MGRVVVWRQAIATYIFHASSGSATATTDLAVPVLGMVNVSLAGINGGTNLVYGLYSVDASGRVFMQGPQVQGATFVGNSTRGLPAFGMITGNDMSAANANAVMAPFTLDTRGAMRSVLSSGAASIGSVAISGTAFIATATLTGLSAVYVTASGQVTAWISGTATITGNVGVSAGSLTAFPASSTSLIVDAIGNVSGQTVASFNYIKSSAGNTWDRWNGVPAHATSSGAGASAFGMVAPMFQFDDGSVQAAQENFFGVPRMSSQRIMYVTATAAWAITGNVGVSAGTVTALIASAGVSGVAAHGAVATSSPVRVGLKAAAFVSSTTGAAGTQATDANTVNWYGSRNGVPFVMGGDPYLRFREMETSAATGQLAFITASANSKIVITEAGVDYPANASANVSFRMAFGSANGQVALDATPLLSAQGVTANNTINPLVLYHRAIPPGAGVIRGNGAGIIAVGWDGCPVIVSAGAPGGQRVSFWVTYYYVPS